MTHWDDRFMEMAGHELAYAAGYVDGEGCLWIGPRWKIGVTIANTHKPTIEWFHQRFGGSLSKARPPRKANHRPVYQWQIVSRDAARFLKQVAPYLGEKTEQALLLISLQQTMGMPLLGRKVAPEVAEERDRLAGLFKGMKHVSW